MTIRQLVIGVTLFLMPTPLARFILCFCKSVHIASTARIGFSLVIADKITMSDGAKIGHLNLVKCRTLNMGEDSHIKNVNIIRGVYDVSLANQAVINHSNTIVNSLNIPSLNQAFTIPELKIGYNSIIGVKHFLDMTANITIGENSILAGRSSELWTHAFYHQHTGSGRYMIRGAINIGNNCYIGSHVIFNCGVSVADTATVAAGAIVSKDIVRGGGILRSAA